MEIEGQQHSFFWFLIFFQILLQNIFHFHFSNSRVEFENKFLFQFLFKELLKYIKWCKFI